MLFSNNITLFALRKNLDKEEKTIAMARVCEISGKKVMTGNNVSHSLRRTKRKFYPNLITKKFYIPEEDKWVTMKVSTSVLRTINKKGISAVLKEANAKK